VPFDPYFRRALNQGFRSVVGVDEVGRGCLAGPVVAAAVVIPLSKLESLSGIRDSKKLTPNQRKHFLKAIEDSAQAISWERVEHDTIDEINILQASRLAMKRAIQKLNCTAEYLLIDGKESLDLNIAQETIIQGDDKSPLISAASIVAKVTRDRIMEEYSVEFPLYQFARHKGYPTEIHRNLLQTYGPCAIHRKTFRHVRDFIASSD
jgi:ribonuclease HII